MQKSELFKVIGAILLCIGTSIGGGILALPIATAHGGFFAAVLYIIVCWLLMTYGAFLILEANFYLPKGANLISMARLTLGGVGQVITWFLYLALLYTLLCAYLAGGADVLQAVLTLINIELDHIAALLVFLAGLGLVVALGIKAVDVVNRILMIVKMLSLVALIFSIMLKVHPALLTAHYNFLAIIPTFSVLITSFGFAIIVPTLRTYLNDNTQQLRRVIFLGGLIPLIIYLLWELVIFGFIEHTVLQELANKGASPSELLAAIWQGSHSKLIQNLANIFMTITVFTSFLGVAISLVDFLFDGFKIEKSSSSAIIVYAVAFLPPLIIGLYFPAMFQVGIQFAGVIVILLLVLLPACMVYRARYQLNIESQFVSYGKQGSIKLFILIIALASVYFIFTFV